MAEARKAKTETILEAEKQQEAAEVMAFLGELAPEEKRDFLTFLQAFRLAKSIIQTA